MDALTALELEELEYKLQDAERKMEAAFERNDEPKFEIYDRMVSRFSKEIAELKAYNSRSM